MANANPKILLIEDDPAQVLMYEIEFDNFGYKLKLASKGQDGLEMAKKDRPDLILLDLLLGDMSGIDVLKELKADPKTKDVKVVIMTNYFKKGLEEEVRQIGAIDFWKKSQFVPREIVEKVKVVLNIEE